MGSWCFLWFKVALTHPVMSKSPLLVRWISGVGRVKRSSIEVEMRESMVCSRMVKINSIEKKLRKSVIVTM